MLAQAQTSGTLIHGIGHAEMKYNLGVAQSAVWFPLPMNYASQVPLQLKITVEPKTVLDKIVYHKDRHSNWGAFVYLKKNKSADRVVLHWDAVVLTKNIADAERAKVYMATEPVENWLNATPLVQFDEPAIQNLANTLSSGVFSPVQKMHNIIMWTSTHIKPPANDLVGLDATTVMKDRVSSCTGYANLSVALGRAMGLPARSVANLLVGVPQQMHSISEFYLGKDLGWRRVEPQGQRDVIPESYALIIRLNETTEDEMYSNPVSIPGVPFWSIITPMYGIERFEPLPATVFQNCPECLQEAQIHSQLISTSDELSKAFDRAKILWARDEKKYLDEKMDLKTEMKRDKVYTVKTIKDLNNFLKSLN